MLDVRKLMKEINNLYDYGEGKYNSFLSYLEELNFIKNKEDKYVITKKWVDFSGKLTREDFVSSLVCYYPPFFKHLLWKNYREAYAIGQSGDGESLYEFIDSIPKLAKKILDLKEKKLIETDEIKSFYGPVFKGYPQYRNILNRLKTIQLAEDIEDTEVAKIGKTPNDIWIKERKLSSNIELEVLKEKNQYTLTPYVYKDYEVTEEVKGILSHPWKTFVIILGMIISEYKAEGIDGISIRPQDRKTPYSKQSIEIFIYDNKGKEHKLGKLKDLVKRFCDHNHFYLFPNKSPDVDTILFQLMDARELTYKNDEYILSPSFDERLYSSEGIIIKNRARKFKAMLKDFIEDLRKTL